MVNVYNQLQSNPNLIFSLYYPIANKSLYLIGPLESTLITLPELSTACVRNHLFDQLNISCLTSYTVTEPGRMIAGELASYSASDGEMSLVYELSNLTVPRNSRMIAIEFNVFSPPSGDVAISKVMFERSIHGHFIASSWVTVIPHHFYYFGGSGTASDWILVVGQLIIFIAACIGLLFLVGRRIVERTLFQYPSGTDVSLFVVCVLCIGSFGIQYSAFVSGPLNDANLGVVKSVNLSETAAKFANVNALNGIIIMSQFAILLFSVIPINRHLFFLVAVFLGLMAIVAVLLNIGSPSLFSFSDAINLLNRVSLRFLSGNHLNSLSTNIFETVPILVFYAFVTYWTCGLFFGYFLNTYITSSSSENHKLKSPRSNKRDASEEADESLVTSLEVMAGRAVTEISSIKTEMDQALDAVKQNISLAKRRIALVRIA